MAVKQDRFAGRKDLQLEPISLQDPKKRETYDRYGEQGLKEGGGERDMGDDLLSRLFGFGGMGGGRRGPRRGEDVVHPMVRGFGMLAHHRRTCSSVLAFYRFFEW
jgi:hypothetical protein